MTTEKLYYIDSHMFTFEAKVLECRKEKSGWAVILDRTAFFPEGGGQRANTSSPDLFTAGTAMITSASTWAPNA